MRDESSQVVGAASAPAPHGPSSPSGRGPASVPRGSPTLMRALLAVAGWREGVLLFSADSVRWEAGFRAQVIAASACRSWGSRGQHPRATGEPKIPLGTCLQAALPCVSTPSPPHHPGSEQQA